MLLGSVAHIRPQVAHICHPLVNTGQLVTEIMRILAVGVKANHNSLAGR
jgi:hypothetical protein